MKPRKRNHPVLAGVLIALFVGSMTRTVLLLRGEAEPPSGAGPTTEPLPTSVSDNNTALPFLVPASHRDPFFHPALPRLSASQENSPSAVTGIPAKTALKFDEPSVQTTAFGPAAPMSIKPLPEVMGPPASGALLPASNGAAMAPERTATFTTSTIETKEVAANQNSLPIGWRLTAVLNGDRPRAILEGIGTGPRAVGIGDRVRDFLVAAIRSSEIVLRSKNSLWTLPLHSANDVENKPAERASDSVPRLEIGPMAPQSLGGKP